MAKKVVSVDETFEDVLKWDQDGALLVFDHEPGKFLELSPGQIDQLSYHGKGAYMVSKQLNTKAIEEADVPSFMKGATIFQAASATARLEVGNKVPGKHYVWKRPDEYGAALRDGYKVTNSDAVETYANRVGTTHVVGAKGFEELILMEIPEEVAMARLRAVEKVSQERVKGAEASAVSQMKGAGGTPLESTDDTSGGWKIVQDHE